MSDLSRLLDDVYQNGPVTPAAKRPAPEPAAPAAAAPAAAPPAPPPAPAAAPPPAPDPDMAWASDESMDEAFADWVPGPGAGAPAAERELFALADDEPTSSVLDHVFATDEQAAGPLEQAMAADTAGVDLFDADVFDDVRAPTQPVSALTDLFDEVAEPALGAAAPAPTPAAHEAPAPQAPSPQASAPRPTARPEQSAATTAAAPGATRVQAAPLAYEPPATLAEALLEAPDAPPADFAREAERDWPIAGFAPDTAPTAVAAGVLATGWRRDHDDLLPTRGRRRR